MPVALIMSVLLDLVESHGMERVEREVIVPPRETAESVAQWEEPERWDGLS